MFRMIFHCILKFILLILYILFDMVGSYQKGRNYP